VALGLAGLAAVAVLIPLAAWAQPSDAVYAVPPPASHGSLPAGWGLYATLHGRTTDLQEGDGWTDDPRVQARDIEAGYGWHGEHTSAVIGYDQHDYGPKYDAPLPATARSPGDPREVGSSGVLGLSLVMHAP